MEATSAITPRDVSTTLNYWKPLDDHPPHIYAYAVEGKPRTNVDKGPHPAVIYDARGRESEFSLDQNAFQWVHWPSAEKDFLNDDVIKEKYYPEVEKILKSVTGAKRIHIFDHTVRRSPNAEDYKDPKNRGPAELVHVDQTYEAAIDRVKYHLGDEADRLLKSRVRIINVWRPIANPVAHKPLAVSDWRTLDEASLIHTALYYPNRTGSIFNVRYSPDLKWYYLGEQTPDEVTLIKCYDSDTDKARLTPHTAFTDEGSPKDAPTRQSIEVRALVFDSE